MLLQKLEYKLFRWDFLVKCTKVSILSIKKDKTFIKREEKIFFNKKTFFSNFKNLSNFESGTAVQLSKYVEFEKTQKWKGRPNCSFTKHVASHHSGILSMYSLWRWDGKILYSKSFTNVRITISWHTFFRHLSCWFLLF